MIVRKGGLEPKATVEMIELFENQCCTVLHGVAPVGPRGPIPSGSNTGTLVQRCVQIAEQDNGADNGTSSTSDDLDQNRLRVARSVEKL